MGRSNWTQNRQRPATAAVFFELRSCVTWALSGGNGPRYSLHALAEYREYDEGLIFWTLFCDKTLLYQNEKTRNAHGKFICS